MEIYLDHAATSHPKPTCVLAAIHRALTDDNANPGRSGHRRALRAGETVLNARTSVARLLGAEDPFSVIFAFNGTDALNLAIKGAVPYGGHVITSYLEHNSVLRPLNALRERQGVTTTLIAPTANGAIDPDDVRRAIRPHTALIVLTHASNVTGAIQPVAAVGEIARAAGIPYLIDGAQAIGTLPVDVRALGCQMYAFPGHKSIRGPQGTGGLWLDPQMPLNTLREGGTGSSSDRMQQPEERPERYESGTVNLPGIAGVGAGAVDARAHLRERLAHERALTDALIEALQTVPDVVIYTPIASVDRVGVVSFNVGDWSSSQMADHLNERGICVRGGLHCAPGTHQILKTMDRGAVRVSVGPETTFEEIDALIRALREA